MSTLKFPSNGTDYDMAPLNPTTLLQRISKLDIQLKTSNEVRLKWGRKHLSVGVYALTILNIFRQPRTFSDGLKLAMQIEDSDTGTLSSTITQLFDAGVLKGVGVIKERDRSADDFGEPNIHIAMLNDRVRTARFLKAIDEVIRPGDVVVDLGSGTGVLAMAAARAGASHVYAIEANPRVAEIAQSNFTRNGLADRITLCKGRSTAITLPERADVLVSEIIGDDPFDEQIIAMTTDARLRLLKPNARMIPSRIEVFGLPVTIPPAKYAEFVFSSETVAMWREWYDLDFSALTEVPHPHEAPIFHINPQTARDWDRLSQPLRLADIDLEKYAEQQLNYGENVVAQARGLLNGLLIYFQVTLSSQTCLSTHPDAADADNHWRSPVWGAFPTLDVQVGDPFVVQYEADSQRNWTFATIFKRDQPVTEPQALDAVR